MCVGDVRKKEMRSKRWEVYVSVTCMWLFKCLYRLVLNVFRVPSTMILCYAYVTGSAKTDHLVPAIEIEIAQ